MSNFFEPNILEPLTEKNIKKGTLILEGSLSSGEMRWWIILILDISILGETEYVSWVYVYSSTRRLLGQPEQQYTIEGFIEEAGDSVTYRKFL